MNDISKKKYQKKSNTPSRKSLHKVSQIIFDPETRQRYKKGNKLGGGGFGEVYEFIDIDTNKIYAGKIIPLYKIEKDPLSNIAFNNENKFNNNLNFEYICKCYSSFKDNKNAYFILEYHPNKTLSELIQKRNTLSEFEVKHYGYQILLALEYLHNCNIIHRDIKLSNVLLSEKMEVRLCDFGLAIENGGDGEQTICGTPNYIAPEVLIRKNNNSYSFEIDIWSFGIILYSLLFHKTPFEAENQVKTKYNIINVIYKFPNNINISDDAKDIIMKIFVKEPYLRPKINEIKEHPFFDNGKGIPKYLPTSTLTQPLSDFEIEHIIKNALNNDECLDNEKIIYNNNKVYNIYRFSNSFNFNDNLRKYLNTNKNNSEDNEEEKKENNENLTDKENQIIKKNSLDENEVSNQQSHSYSDSNSLKEEKNSNNFNKNNIQSLQIGNEDKTNQNNETGGFIGENLNNNPPIIDENEIKNPIIVEKFIDCSDKFGIGYLLSNGDIGIYFNDSTKMVLIKNTHYIYYINKNNDNQIIINFKGSIINELDGKRRILKLFYKNLMKNVKNKEDFNLNPALNHNNITGYVIKWEKTQYAFFFLLSSNVIQVKYNDKTELLFFVYEKYIQYIDKNKKKYKESFDNSKPIQFKNEEINKRVIYARNILSRK